MIEMSKQKNFYAKLEPKYQGGELTYKNKNKLNIDIPFRMLILGSSGTGKTNTLLNIVDQLNCFHRFYIFCRNLDQPLYRFFIDKLKGVAQNVGVGEDDLFVASNTLDDLPEIDKFDKNVNNLVIIDDFVGDSNKNLKKVENFFLRSRTKNTSMVFITQSYFQTPKMIRLNSDYIVFKRSNDMRDLKMVVDNYFKGEDKAIITLYKKVMELPGNENFILFDLKTSNPKLRVRVNFG